MYAEKRLLCLPLIVWMLLQLLYGVCDGQILMYGSADSVFTGVVRVINRTVTWRDAHAACLNMGYGKLMHSQYNGDRVVYTRKVLIENGWPDMPLWIGYLKDESTNKWQKITSTCSALGNSGQYAFDNDLANTQLCLLVNMTSATSEQAWYGAPCEEKHYFICEDPTATKTTKTKDASLIIGLPTSKLTTTYDCPQSCCRGKILSYVNIPAVQLDLSNGSCVHLSDDVIHFPLPYYVNTSATGSDVIAATTVMTVVVLNDNGTIGYTWNTDLSCYTSPPTTTTTDYTSPLTTTTIDYTSPPTTTTTDYTSPPTTTTTDYTSPTTTTTTDYTSPPTTTTTDYTSPTTTDNASSMTITQETSSAFSSTTSTGRSTTSTGRSTTSTGRSTTSTGRSTTSTGRSTTSTGRSTTSTGRRTTSTGRSTPLTVGSASSALYTGQCVYHNSTPANNVTTCRTFCKANKDLITDAILRRWLSGIREDLTLNKKLLSSYIRNHVSADDDRVTSKALGLFGVCLMLAFFSVIFLSDVISLGQGKYDLVRSRASMARYALAKSKKAASIRTSRGTGRGRAI